MLEIIEYVVYVVRSIVFHVYNVFDVFQHQEANLFISEYLLTVRMGFLILGEISAY